MRNACKNVMYTVVSSWAYDGEHEETGMENWKKAGIGIDIVIALFMAGMEVLVIKGYKKRRMLNKDESGMENSYETAKIG